MPSGGLSRRWKSAKEDNGKNKIFPNSPRQNSGARNDQKEILQLSNFALITERSEKILPKSPDIRNEPDHRICSCFVFH